MGIRGNRGTSEISAVSAAPIVSAVPSGEVCAAHTAPIAGMVYLRRPVGAVDQLTTADTNAEPATGGVAGPETTGGVAVAHKGAPTPVETPDTGRALLSGPSSPASRQAATREIARLLWLWLEAYDGRRPVSALRRGPFSPTALDELRGLIRTTIEHRQGVPSRLLRVHLPPSHHHRLAFTASAAVNGRVRALVGHLARYDSRWRVESVTLLQAS